MGFKKKGGHNEINLNLVPMIDITSFILLALAILVMSMKKEASLDNILKLPPVLYSSKQDKTQLQIYVLPATIQKGGQVNFDSTGLVAFAGKANVPNNCPNCAAQLHDAAKEYVPGSLLDVNGIPVRNLQAATDDVSAEQLKNERPPAYLCAKCGVEISPYLKLDDIPRELKKKKKEVVDMLVATENFSRQKRGLGPIGPAEVRKIEEDLPLLIKADEKAFFGRILQVINMAEDTSCNIRKFVFVTLADASIEAQKKSSK